MKQWLKKITNSHSPVGWAMLGGMWIGLGLSHLYDGNIVPFAILSGLGVVVYVLAERAYRRYWIKVEVQIAEIQDEIRYIESQRT